MSLRTRSRLLAVPLAAAAIVITAAPAVADELSDARAEAARIATQLESLRVEASTLDEQYNQVAVELVTIQADVASAEADVVRFSGELAAMRGEAGGMALTTYMNPNVVGPLTGMLGGSAAGNEAAQRQGYTSVVLGVSTSLTDQLKATTDDAQAAEAVLAAALDRQTELQAELAESQVAVSGAITEHEALQASVQGELARLVAEEQARREAAEAEAARQREAERVAEARRQEAEAQAAQRAEAEADDARQAQEAPSSASEARSSDDGSEDDDDTPAPAPAATSSQSSQSQSSQAPRQTSAPTTAQQQEAAEEEDDEPASSGSGGNVPSPSPGASGAVEAAMSQLGVMYRFAAAQPGVAFDCSGLTKWAWGQAGVSLPHSSKQQYAVLPHIPSDQARPGDLFFFGSPIHHVGMYIGDGQMVNATQTGRPVSISNAYRKDLVGVARPG